LGDAGTVDRLSRTRAAPATPTLIWIALCLARAGAAATGSGRRAPGSYGRAIKVAPRGALAGLGTANARTPVAQQGRRAFGAPGAALVAQGGAVPHDRFTGASSEHPPCELRLARLPPPAREVCRTDGRHFGCIFATATWALLKHSGADGRSEQEIGMFASLTSPLSRLRLESEAARTPFVVLQRIAWRSWRPSGLAVRQRSARRGKITSPGLNRSSDPHPGASCANSESQQESGE
jgi:hypothetical protein